MARWHSPAGSRATPRHRWCSTQTASTRTQGCSADLAERDAPTVLTPHAGELGRLLELDSEEIDLERLRYVRAAAAQYGGDRRVEGR